MTESTCAECGRTPTVADRERFTFNRPDPQAAELAERGEARWCAACGAGMAAQLGRLDKPRAFAVRRDDEGGRLVGYWQGEWKDREEEQGTWVEATNQQGDRVQILIFDDEELYRLCRGCGEPLDPNDEDAGPLECGECYRGASDEDEEPEPWRSVYRVTILVDTASPLHAVVEAARTANAALRDLGGLLDVESDEDHLRVAVERVGEAAL